VSTSHSTRRWKSYIRQAVKSWHHRSKLRPPWRVCYKLPSTQGKRRVADATCCSAGRTCSGPRVHWAHDRMQWWITVPVQHSLNSMSSHPRTRGELNTLNSTATRPNNISPPVNVRLSLRERERERERTFACYYRLKEPIMQLLYGQKNGLHAFDYNSAETRKWTDLDEIWNNVRQMMGASPGRFWARFAQ